MVLFHHEAAHLGADGDWPKVSKALYEGVNSYCLHDDSSVERRIGMHEFSKPAEFPVADSPGIVGNQFSVCFRQNRCSSLYLKEL